MIKLSVITSYYNRPIALDGFEKFKSSVNNPEIEFIIEKWDKENGVFSTAFCHNRAVLKAHGEWILKQDIDCLCDLEMYDRILHLIRYRDLKWFANFGCINYVRVKNTGYPTGNLYLCSRAAYWAVGGEPIFMGYGHEDYAILYALMKNFNGDGFRLDYSVDNIDSVIREEIARPLNKLYQDIYFTHHDHERQPKEMRAMSELNKKKLYEYCRTIDEETE